MTKTDLDLLITLADELATEIDMYYDVEDAASVRSSIAAISKARAIIGREGAVCPGSVDHVVRKFSYH